MIFVARRDPRLKPRGTWRRSGAFRQTYRARFAASGSLSQEVGDEALAVVGKDGFGVELDAFDGEGLVAEAHDGAGVGGAGARGDARGDLELFGDGVLADDERVVAGAGHGLREVAEDAAVVVLDGRGFAVHELWSADDLGTEGRADGLMAEADAEGGDLLGGGKCGESLDERDEDAGVLRGAGAGREEDARGAEGDDFVGRELVVAFDDDLPSAPNSPMYWTRL